MTNLAVNGGLLGQKARSPTLTALVHRSLLVPICLVIGAIVLAIGCYTPLAVVNAALDDAVLKGLEAAEQIKALRVFYSDNVVLKAVKGGAKASPSYKSDPTAIPVPTTFILDATKAFSTDDAQVRLVSPYPWPMRAGRVLDDFQQNAWEQLTRDPASHVMRRETVGGRELLRVAVGDRMDASCVACHNSNPLSPKRDWKVGDVRGIIEVVRPIDQITARARRLSWQLTGGVALAGLVLLAALYAIGRRLVRPMRDLAGVIDRIARGHLDQEVPHTSRADELGTVARALLNLQDQTGDRLRAEALISHMALHDGLTDLPNRTLFGEELTRALRGRQPDGEVVLFCLDLDRFKSVNDTLGHPIGDALLQAVGNRLRRFAADNIVVARLGGDEFALIALTRKGSPEAGRLAERVLAQLGALYEIDGRQLLISTSVGIAVAPADASTAENLLKNADLALYRAKSEGRSTFRFFEPEMDVQVRARREMELDLRRALAANEFELHYQPLVDLRSGKLCGFETLLRWRHPVRGMIPPADFIPIAEETGEIEAIGAWVLHTACRVAVTWPEAVRVAINLSPVQFRSGTLALHVVAALAASGLHARRLELEITESLMLQDTEATMVSLHELRSLGAHIVMDDFGTGYFSLSYLLRFPFNKIKIDRSFVRDLCAEDGSAAVVQAVMTLASGLGISTTAEGVETLEQLEHLRREGCHEAQGYLISPPLTAGAIADILSPQAAGGREAA